MEFGQADWTHDDRQGDGGSYLPDSGDPLETVSRLVSLGRGAEALSCLKSLNPTGLPVDRQMDALVLEGDALTELSRYADAHQSYLQAVDLQRKYGRLRHETLIKAACSAMRVLDVESFRSLISFLKSVEEDEMILRYLSTEVNRMSSDEKCTWNYYTLGMASHKPQEWLKIDAVSQLIANGHWDEAIDILMNLPNHDCLAIWLKLAELYRSMNQYHQAVGILERASEYFPNSWRLSYALGLAWEYISFEQAKGYFQRAISLYPESCEAWLRLGFVLANQAQFSKSIEAAQYAIRLSIESGFPMCLRERALAETLLVRAQAATSLPIYSVGFWRRFLRGIKSLQMTKRFVVTFWGRVKSLREAIEGAGGHPS